MKSFVRSVALATGTAFLMSAAVARAEAVPTALPDADPAMWVVKDSDTTIYLFGTFHVMDGKADWFNEEVKTAFDQSQEVVLEANLPEDPASLAPLLRKYSVDPSGKPLTAKLSATGQAKLTKVLSEMGAPANAFDKFTPMFASMSLAMVAYQKLGMTADKGTETALTAAAKANNKKLGELEGFEKQLKMLERIPQDAQIKALEELLTDYEQGPDTIRQMVGYWNSGDAEGFAKLMRKMQAGTPEVYSVLMTDRNKEWAEWIDQRLDKPGTVFVAVGAAHLAGRDSVQHFLEGRGIKSSRAR